MSRKADAAYHPDRPPPVVAVHLVVLYEAACHSCGWASGPLNIELDADTLADAHQC